MNEDDQRLVDLLRVTLPPLVEPSSPLDLWPRLRRRLDGRGAGVGKLDWLMTALVLGLLAGFPETVLLVLYHL